jgi:transposase
MRGADTFTESLFLMKRLDDFVPTGHPLRAIRERVNKGLVAMNGLFADMYEADIKGGRPSVAPEMLLRAMLLQVLYSVRCERMLMEQIQYNRLFRWFVGLAMDDTVWVPTFFTNSRQRLIAHDAVVKLFNQIVAQVDEQELLSGEHFTVDGTLIQAWAGYKSFVTKDCKDGEGSDSINFRNQRRSDETHESSTDGNARLYRKGKTASELSFMGHTRTDNRNGLVVNAMCNDARQVHAEETTLAFGAEKGFDVKEFIEDLQEMNVLPHVAHNKSGCQSVVPDAVAASEGYEISQEKRKRIEQGIGWSKTVGRMRQVLVRGLKKVDQMLVLTMTAHNLTRLRTLGRVPLQGAR